MVLDIVSVPKACKHLLVPTEVHSLCINVTIIG